MLEMSHTHFGKRNGDSLSQVCSFAYTGKENISQVIYEEYLGPLFH